MPDLVRKLVVFAAVDGLILQPSTQRNQRAIPSLRIKYNTHEVTSVDPVPRRIDSPTPALDLYGIVGLLTVASSSYLIAISRRQQVAQIQGVPIFVVTGIAVIPLSSQPDAKSAINQSKEGLKKLSSGEGVGTIDNSDTSEDEEVQPNEANEADEAGIEDSRHNPSVITDPITDRGTGILSSEQNVSTSVAHDVIGRKGQYGRFAERWFSRNGWSTERKRAQGMSIAEPEKIQPSEISNADVRAVERTASLEGSTPDGSIGPFESRNDLAQLSLKTEQAGALGSENVTGTLLPKLLRTTKMLLGSRSFYFSYDHDITRRFGSQEANSSDIPLHNIVDPLFFWNRHLASPFIERGHHAFVLPLMQGFIGQRTFTISNTSKTPRPNSSAAEGGSQIFVEPGTSTVDSPDFLLTLISRRSIVRPGLRYLRRGVDDDGYTANSVETEQILSRPSWGPSDRIYSFTQFRGSIPLFFSQSPYSFKPVPVLQHSFQTNHVAFRRHFMKIVSIYGGVQIVLLVDKHGGEAEIGEQYEKHTKQANDEENGIEGTKLGEYWWDYHTECRGMKFENVIKLVKLLDVKLDEFGSTCAVSGTIERKQSGVLRTNCMDCLDRTNVVQSACGQRVLEKQLKEEGVEVDLQTDTTTQWFNTLWADNGDAISKQYSSTAALKGDYTRTRKRNYRGAINDFGLTLSRYFNNIVNDYFSQAAIDYLLGNVTSQVFEEFEADMMSGDPGMSMHKVRANAIDTSAKIVIADQHEDLVGGWTLLSPQEPNTVRTFPFEEVVLLVTNAALYAVRFDWNMEKVSSFERVDLRSMTGIMRGTYITSTLAVAQTDEQRNVGLVIKYRPGKEDVARVNTRSLSTFVDSEEKSEESQASRVPITTRTERKGNISTLKILAFKALPARSSLAGVDGQQTHTISERELVASICDEIRRAVSNGETSGVGSDGSAGFIEDREIISLLEARKSTGLLEQWGHSLKKLVWA